jgi:hypothetical protein
LQEVKRLMKKFKEYCLEARIIERGLLNSYFNSECLAKVGEDVTEEFIANNPFGYLKNLNEEILLNHEDFVAKSRIEDLKSINSKEFDLSRLIKLCEEINSNYKMGNYLSVGMIGRTILNHIPPIFGLRSFDEVANNIGTKSFKDSMRQLSVYFKNVADSYLHQQIRKKEVLPNPAQVEFRSPLDVLLESVILKLHN